MLDPREASLKELIFGSAFVVLLLAISIIFFFIVYQKRLLAERLRLQAVESDYQRQLLTSSVDVQEKERIRIGQDLHDEIGSSLSAIKMLVGQITMHNNESEELISTITQGIGNTINDVRNIANNLYPSVLAKFGLADALQYLINMLSAGNNLAIELDTDNSFELSFEYELAVYRIIQELANNALKHAKANHLIISVKSAENNLLLIVKDDGCGFDADKIRDLKQTGIGLKSIQTRISILQADLHITSKKDKGTAVEIKIPLINN
jgi:signal transduction histidine kinase